VDHVLDARGLRCPLPLLRARAALSGLSDADTLIVLADDREAPIDLAALAADAGRGFAQDGERFVLAPEQ
jgi:tRNA 2-thiouridine synthesizing protein A